MLEIFHTKLNSLKAILYQMDERNVLLVNDCAGLTPCELADIERRAERRARHGVTACISGFLGGRFEVLAIGRSERSRGRRHE